MKKIWLVVVLMCAPAFAQNAAVNGWCEDGGIKAKTQGLDSTNTVQGSYPKCRVTVYFTGTTTKAPIYPAIGGGTLTNPFTADTNGIWLFYAALGTGVDIVMDQGTPIAFPAPVALKDIIVGGGGVSTSLALTTTGTSGASVLTGDPGTGYHLNVPNYAGVTLETNGVNNADQTYLDAVAGNNMTITNTAGGHVRFDAVASAVGSFQQQVVPPITGQHVVIYPTSLTATGLNRAIAVTTPGSIGATVTFYEGCGGLALCSATLTWSGYALPSYVNPANVTAVYPFMNYSFNQTIGGSTLTVLPTSGTFGPPVVPAPMGQYTAGTGLTGAQIAGASMVWSIAHSLPIVDPHPFLNVASAGLIVYYTGTAPPTNTSVVVDPPLFFNGTTLDLGIDPFALSYSVGMAIGALPAASSQTNYTYFVTDGATTSDCTTGGGTSKLFCYSNGTAWTAVTGGGGGGTPGGLNTQLQYNNAGAFGGDTGSTTDGAGNLTAKSYTAGDGTGNGGFMNAVEGTMSLTPTAGRDQLQASSASHCLEYSANGGSFTCIGGGAYWQLTGIPQSAQPAQATNAITTIANSVINSNHAYFTDGTDYWCPGPAYCSGVNQGMYADDFGLTALAYPSYFTPSQILNVVTKFRANVNVNGEFPIAIQLNGASPIYYSAWDAHHAFATGDGAIMVPELLFLYCQKVGISSSSCSSAYTANVAAIKTAYAFQPQSGGLINIVAGNEYIPSQAFMEYMRKTGLDANANVWYAWNLKKMAVLATAAGDSTNATFFNSTLATVVAGIRANLIDGTSGLLIAATGQNSTNLDVVSSSLAVYCDNDPDAPCGVLTGAQKTAISNYFFANYSTLTYNGYVRETPTAWATLGTIPAGGGPPYTASGYTGTQYQGGYWSFHTGWFLSALARETTTPASALPTVNTILSQYLAQASSGDAATEWYNIGDTVPRGTTPNLESPAGPKMAMDLFPAPLTQTAGTAHVNIYGAIDGTSAGSGLIYGTNAIATANTPVVFDGSSTNLELFQMKGTNTTGSRFKLDNGTNSLWFLELGSAFGSYAGSGCVQSGPTSGPVAMQCWQNTDSVHGLVSMMPGLSLKWTGTPGDPNQAQATGISALTSGTVSVDTTTQGDSAGTLKAANVTTGANILYRCTTAGALPVGALTIATGNCGASTDTGLRVN